MHSGSVLLVDISMAKLAQAREAAVMITHGASWLQIAYVACPAVTTAVAFLQVVLFMARCPVSAAGRKTAWMHDHAYFGGTPKLRSTLVGCLKLYHLMVVGPRCASGTQPA